MSVSQPQVLCWPAYLPLMRVCSTNANNLLFVLLKNRLLTLYSPCFSSNFYAKQPTCKQSVLREDASEQQGSLDAGTRTCSPQAVMWVLCDACMLDACTLCGRHAFTCYKGSLDSRFGKALSRVPAVKAHCLHCGDTHMPLRLTVLRQIGCRCSGHQMTGGYFSLSPEGI